MPGGDEGLILENNFCVGRHPSQKIIFSCPALRCSIPRARTGEWRDAARGARPALREHVPPDRRAPPLAASLVQRVRHAGRVRSAQDGARAREAQLYGYAMRRFSRDLAAVPDLDAKVAGVRAAAVACSLSKSECSRPPAPEDE